jgi:NADH:ubiquinone oxidoreductase subunit F (NADH-binding)
VTVLDAASDTARLLAGVDDPAWRPGLAHHLATYGALPLRRGDRRWADALVAALGEAGLTGRGGAGFPTAVKIDGVRRRRQRPLVAVNLMEGEPASFKDRTLAVRAPHLVLDGAELVAAAVNAHHVVVCVARDHRAAVEAIEDAVSERQAAGLTTSGLQVRTPPGRYVAGEESALAHWLDGGESRPTFRPDRPATVRVNRRPALVDNAETLAHVALIARYGASWFRGAGTLEAPGTTLVTVTGAVAAPGVTEVPMGTPVRSVLAAARPTAELGAALLGGYGGTWLPARAFDAPLEPGRLSRLGQTLGAGVLVALPRASCGLAETARIAHYMASESAGQCGPCVFGLPDLAADLTALTTGRAGPSLLDRLHHRLEAVEGRGACRHPDGVVRLVRSALAAFGADVDHHLRHGPCAGVGAPSVLTFPRPTGEPAWR